MKRTLSAVADFETGASGDRSQGMYGFWKWELHSADSRQGDRDNSPTIERKWGAVLPVTHQREPSPARTLILAQ